MITKEEFADVVIDLYEKYAYTDMSVHEFTDEVVAAVDHLGASEYWKQQREGDGFAIQ